MHTALKVLILYCLIRNNECYITLESIKYTGNKDVSVNSTIKTKLNKQYIDMDLRFAYDIDHKFNMQNNWYIFARNKWIELMRSDEVDSCVFVKRYIGPLWPYFLNKANIPASTCFYPKGTYHIRDFEMDFRAFSIVMLPKGRTQTCLKVIRKTNREIIAIIEAVIINK